MTSLHDLIQTKENAFSGIIPDNVDKIMYGAEKDYSFFDKILEEVNPKNILEVGSWLNYSSIHMAKKIKSKKMDTKIVCLDTWIGPRELIGKKINGKNRFFNGMPTGYKHFLANVKREGVDDVIIPFPQIPKSGMRFLSEKGIKFQMIFLNEPKDYNEIRSDLNLSWGLLSGGGVICGNNYLNFSVPQVNAAINSFVYENRMRDCLHVDKDNLSWSIKKKDLI